MTFKSGPLTPETFRELRSALKLIFELAQDNHFVEDILSRVWFDSDGAIWPLVKLKELGYQPNEIVELWHEARNTVTGFLNQLNEGGERAKKFLEHYRNVSRNMTPT